MIDGKVNLHFLQNLNMESGFEKLKECYISSGGEVKELRKEDGKIDVGYRISYSKRISEVDVFAFGLISGDWNPIHFDDSYASKTRFGGKVVHGMLTTSLVSAMVAQIPETPVLLETNFRYLMPVREEDVVEVRGEVVGREGNRFDLEVKCLVGERLVVEGRVKFLLW